MQKILAAALGLSIFGSAVAAPAEPPAPAAPPAAATPAAAAKPAYSSNTVFSEIYANPAAKAALVKAIPGYQEPPEEYYEAVMGMSPRALQEFVPDTYTEAALKRLDEELAKVPAPKPGAAQTPATQPAASAPTPAPVGNPATPPRAAPQ